MFHCHNLIHEDHDMMAAFNVTDLGDWGYTETSRFLDPMEERWRSKDINDHDEEDEEKFKKCALFESLEAYKDVYKLEKALDDYRVNGPPKPTTLQIVASSSAAAAIAPAVTPSASGAGNRAASPTVTSAPKATSTRKADNATKTTSTRRR
jgi:hypothetical protein